VTQPIYLDHNSTSPIDPSVAQTISDCYAAGYVNPASQHQMGQRARRKLERVRTRMAEILGANCAGMQTDQLVLTSGGTESNNLAMIGLCRGAYPDPSVSPNRPARVLISAIEHPSVTGSAEQLVRMGYEVERIPVDRHGVCELDVFESLIDEQTILVSMMLANNETGVIQGVAEAAAICRKQGVLIHTDAVQAVGKIPVNFGELGVDALSFTAHKLGGPRGIGGLLIRHGLTPQPILFGGFQQMAIRPGTEDVALAAGMCQALELYQADPQGRSDSLATLRDRLQNELQAQFDDLVVNGGDAPRVPHTLNISFPGIDRQSFLLAADMAGLAISTGSACASGSSELSPVLLAMKLENEVVAGSIRISLGISTTEAEITESTRRIGKIIHDLRGRN
jgi:cysteine desulfurase